jgi:transposase-like protein
MTKQLRVPLTHNQIDINCCPNPKCQNFNEKANASGKDDKYLISGLPNQASVLKCKGCNRHFTIKSNAAVTEELERFVAKEELSTVYRQDGTACHKVSCDNFGCTVKDHPEKYRKKGNTPAGNQRYQCKGCKKGFTYGSKKRLSHPSSKNHENKTLFMLIVNQMPINRIIEMTDLAPPTIYKKIDMFYQRCLAFLNERESRLPSMPLRLMQLSTDRQDYRVNWTDRKRKNNVMLSAIGTADKRTQYIFGMEVNYDPCIDINHLQNSLEYQEDANLKVHMRTYARLWTPRDFSKAKKEKVEHSRNTKELLDEYLNMSNITLREASKTYIRNDILIESGTNPYDIPDSGRLPEYGAQVHSEYTMFAHFRHLNSLIGHAEKIRFYLDQDDGIYRACSLAFAKSVDIKRTDIAYVKIDKATTVDERRIKVAIAEKSINELIKENQVSSYKEAERLLVRKSMLNSYTIGKRKDIWNFVPIHKIYEVDKYISFISDDTKLTEDEKIDFLLSATLHPIDNFFQLVRRRISSLERPIHSQSNRGRTWTGKSPYNPAMIHKLLIILRTYFNYCLVSDKDKKTPAERLGLARGQVEIRKILY